MANPANKKRVLAADDDPIMREMMKARLGDGVDVTVAENGKVAWEMLASNDFDLAIIDLGMPELDGFGLIRYLRQTPKTIDLPIIVATSRGDQQAIEKAFSSGASGFVTKPINWSLFQYDVQFVLKNGATEKELRATKSLADRANRIKDNLLAYFTATLAAPMHREPDTKLAASIASATRYAQLLTHEKPTLQQRHNINDLVAEVVAKAQPQASEKSVVILGRKILANVMIAVDKPLWIETVGFWLARSINSSPDGGTVEILLGGQSDGSLVLSIRDNGPAIAKAEIEKQMGLFAGQKLDFTVASLALDFTLPIVKQVIDMHDGGLVFQHHENTGNVAAIWLPAARVNVDPVEVPEIQTIQQVSAG